MYHNFYFSPIYIKLLQTKHKLATKLYAVQRHISTTDQTPHRALFGAVILAMNQRAHDSPDLHHLSVTGGGEGAHRQHFHFGAYGVGCAKNITDTSLHIGQGRIYREANKA